MPPAVSLSSLIILCVRLDVQDLTLFSLLGLDPDPEVKLLAIRCSYNAFYNLRPLKKERKERSKDK